MTVCPTIQARALGVIPLAIASGLQKRLKTPIEAIALIDRLKAGLKSLPQFLSRRLHSPSLPLPRTPG